MHVTNGKATCDFSVSHHFSYTFFISSTMKLQHLKSSLT